MYEEFFGLNRKPFELVPNPDFLYMSRTHHRVGMYLDYAMKENTGFILLTGEVGSGKTTIIRRLLKTIGPDVQVSKIFNTQLSSEQLIATINDDFGLTIEGRNKVQLLRDLYGFLIAQYGQQRRSVLIIDEAQNLSIDSLEELRMLSNLETNESKLLQIIMVGQPELKKILSVPELRQLRQRISIHCHLYPLGREEMEEYIFHRLEVAGHRQAAAFTGNALDLIFECSGGIPRLINIMCDFLFLSAYADGSREISAQLVAEVAGDPQFEGQFFPRRSAPTSDLPRSSPEPAARTEPPEPAPQPTSLAAEPSLAIPQEIKDLYRQLDYFETSIKEVCNTLLDRDGGGPESRNRDLILDMPKFPVEAKKSGILDGVRRFFTKN